MAYTVQLGPIAERDFWNQIYWLEKNRSERAAAEFEAQVFAVLDRLHAQPYLGSPIRRPAGLVHKALINRKTLLFYRVIEADASVEVLTIRGAAEDWTNQPLT